jgi:Putative zinc-finger
VPAPMTEPFPGESMSPHPTAELIAAYLSGALGRPGVAAFESHLAACRPCRLEVTSARRLLRSDTSRRRWFLATAAAAAVVLGLLTRGSLAPPAPDPLRAGGGESADATPVLAAFAPVDGATIPRKHVRFIWAARAGRPLYHLTLTDPTGRALWLHETSDTTVVLPPEISLIPGRAYYWYVDALDAGGSSLTTGTRRFTLGP